VAKSREALSYKILEITSREASTAVSESLESNNGSVLEFDDDDSLVINPLSKEEIAKQEDFEQMDKMVSKDFFEMAKIIGLDSSQSQSYWQAFLEEPYAEENLIDGKDIYENEVRVNVIGRWEEQFQKR